MFSLKLKVRVVGGATFLLGSPIYHLFVFSSLHCEIQIKKNEKNKTWRLHQTGISITGLLVGKQPTCTGDRLADVSQRAQVGLLGLVTVFA